MSKRNKQLWIYLVTKMEYMDDEFEYIMDVTEDINDDPASPSDATFRGSCEKIGNMWALYVFKEEVLNCDEAVCFVHADFSDYHQFISDQEFDWKPAGLPPKLNVYLYKKKNEDYCEEGLEYIRTHEGKNSCHFGFFENKEDIKDIICEKSDYHYPEPEEKKTGTEKKGSYAYMSFAADVFSDEDSVSEDMSNVIRAFPEENAIREMTKNAAAHKKSDEQSGVVIDFSDAQGKSKDTVRTSIEQNNERILAEKRLEEIREELYQSREKFGTPKGMHRVFDLFDETAELCTKYGIGLDIMNMYAFILDKTGQSEKAYEILKSLEPWYDNGETEDFETVIYYSTIGTLANHVPGKAKEAENYFERLKDLSEELDTSEVMNRYAIAVSFERAGYFCTDRGDFDKAEEYYNKAIPELEKGREEGYSSNDQLLKAYHEMCYIYKQRNDLEQSIKYIRKELDFCKELAEEDPGMYDERLGESYINCGMLHSDAGEIKQGIKYQREATDLYEKLSEDRPGRYDKVLADTYGSISMDYFRLNWFADSRKYIKLAIKYYEALTDRDPSVKQILANAYQQLSNVYKSMYDVPKSEAALRRSKEIREEYEKQKDDADSAKTLEFYMEMARNARSSEQLDTAEQIYLTCYEQSGELMSDDPRDDFVLCHITAGIQLASLYFQLKEYEKTEMYLTKTMELTRKMAELDPYMHEPCLGIEYFNIYGMTHDDKYLSKAYDIAKKYPDVPECVLIVNTMEEKRKGE